MAGEQKHWFDGLPFAGLNGDGSQKHWFDGLPAAEIVIPGGWQPPVTPPKPPKPDKGGGGGKGGGSTKKDVHVLPFSLGSRPVVPTLGVELFAPLYVLATFTASGGTAAGAEQSGSGNEVFAGSGATAAAAEQSGAGSEVFAGTGTTGAAAAQAGTGAGIFTGTGATAAEAASGGSGTVQSGLGFADRARRREPRWRPQPREQYLPPTSPPTLVASGGTAAEAECLGSGGLTLVGAGRSRAAAAMQGAGGVVFGGSGGSGAAARMRGLGSVDNTIPDEDEELVLLLAA